MILSIDENVQGNTGKNSNNLPDLKVYAMYTKGGQQYSTPLYPPVTSNDALDPITGGKNKQKGKDQ